MRKEATFDRIVFGAVGWIVSDANLDPDRFTQTFQIVFKMYLLAVLLPPPSQVSKIEAASG